jgi:hypothetical protein
MKKEYIEYLIKYFENKADDFDNQFHENIVGGWSTNSNKILKNSANEFRRIASELKRML